MSATEFEDARAEFRDQLKQCRTPSIEIGAEPMELQAPSSEFRTSATELRDRTVQPRRESPEPGAPPVEFKTPIAEIAVPLGRIYG